MAAQLFLVVQRHLLHERIQWFTALFLLPRVEVTGTRFSGNFHACAASQVFYRLWKLQVVVLHDKGEFAIAACTTAEAVIKLFVGIDAE